MLKISILTPQSPFSRWANDFYPLIKWKSQFEKSGIKLKFHSSHQSSEVLNADVLILDYRYFQTLINKKAYPDKQFIIEFITKAKAQHLKVVLFDTGDGTGSRCFDLTPHVDVHLKKQLLKNLEEYTIDRGDKSVMCWLPEEFTPSNIPYQPCRSEDLQKLRLGWNLGMIDYRKFPLFAIYPIGTALLLNGLFQKPKTYAPDAPRTIFTSYRGSLKKDTRYSFQRKILLDTLGKLSKKYSIATGAPISLVAFQKEMQNSRVVVSPYGWGEVCYRDFEAFINGAVLVKPSMEHMNTFPNFFIPGETYIPLRWDMLDLEDKFAEIEANQERFASIAAAGQQKFINAITDSESFIKHFKSVVLS